MLDLDGNKLTEVRLIHRASRDIVLAHSEFASYWAGELELLVPLTYD